MKMLHKLIILALFLLRWIQFKLWCRSYLFPRFKYLLLPVLLIFIHFSLFVIPECSRYLEDSCFHSAFVQALLRMLSHSSHSIQLAQSSFKSFNGVSFEWALTHRSFPRILPDSSNYSGAIPNTFQSLT